MNKWDFKMVGERAATVYIYEEIGQFWGLPAKDFAEQLSGLGEIDELTIRINSMGGSVFEGLTMYSLLRDHPAKVTVHIDGIAASIASVIAMAGDEIRIAENGFMMIHKPMVITLGDDEEHLAQAERLQKMERQAVSIYSQKTGLSDAEVVSLLKPETWMNAEEAVAKGFATSIQEPNKVAALVIDRNRFPNAPAAIAHCETKGEAAEKIHQAALEKEAAAVAVRLRVLEVDTAGANG